MDKAGYKAATRSGRMICADALPGAAQDSKRGPGLAQASGALGLVQHRSEEVLESVLKAQSIPLTIQRVLKQRCKINTGF